MFTTHILFGIRNVLNGMEWNGQEWQILRTDKLHTILIENKLFGGSATKQCSGHGKVRVGVSMSSEYSLGTW